MTIPGNGQDEGGSVELTPMERVEQALRTLHLASRMVSGQLMAQCPTHDDGSPSLAIKEADGKVLITCHAGCDTRDIVADLGLEMRDLFSDEPDAQNNTVVVAVYPYVNARTGEIEFEKVRYWPKTFKIRHHDKGGRERWGIPRGTIPRLYNEPALAEAIPQGQPIWIVEGEADVHAMEKMGAVATTQPMGAGPGKWRDHHTRALSRAAEVRIVVDLDPDGREGTNPGRDYALEVRDCLIAAGIKVSLWKAASGKDASDHLKAGFALADFKRYTAPPKRPEGVSGDVLLAKEFRPLVFAVKDILPQGLAILGAPPKAGKSWIALDWAIGVSTGGITMSALQCTAGDVLYLGLEDSERRLKDRIQLLTAGADIDLSRIEFHTMEQWETGMAGLAAIEEWAQGVDSPRLVVVDTLAKAEPTLNDERDRYRAEYALTTHYKRLADRHDMTVVWVHHDRKSSDDDWLKRFSGSQGLTGGVDTLLLIDWKRGERTGYLRLDGRDVTADDIPIYKPQHTPFWLVQKAPENAAELVSGAGLSPIQERIAGFIGGQVSANWKLIRDRFFDEDERELSDALDAMLASGVVTSDNGGYRLPV